MYQYTTDDQEFFFKIANEVLDRFGLLNDMDEDMIFDVILHYSDIIVNTLDAYRQADQQLSVVTPGTSTHIN